MADTIDDAQAVNELHQEISRRNRDALRAEADKPPAEFNGEDCVECEEPVEPARLAHKYYRCACCQQQFEKDRKMRAINGRTD